MMSLDVLSTVFVFEDNVASNFGGAGFLAGYNGDVYLSGNSGSSSIEEGASWCDDFAFYDGVQKCVALNSEYPETP